MKELPLQDRPYEKMELYGPDILSDSELLAIIIKTGNRNETCLQLAQRLLTIKPEDGIEFLKEASIDELKLVKGIGRVKAIQIKAVFELAKRFNRKKVEINKVIKSPKDVSDIVMSELCDKKQEYLKIIVLNTKNVVIKSVTVSIGALNRNIVQAREVFSEPIRLSAASIIMVHNHPSGDPTPSNDDISFTKKYYEYGKLLGIDVLDHLVIGNDKYISLKEKGLF